MLAGIGQPFILNAPPLLAANYFPRMPCASLPPNLRLWLKVVVVVDNDHGSKPADPCLRHSYGFESHW